MHHAFLFRPLAAVTMLLAFFAVSCTSTKKVIYFNDLQDSTANTIKSARASFENPIQKNDQLWISVGGSNLADLQVLNSANGMGVSGSSTSAGGNTNSILGYVVEADGKIQLPYVGKVQVEGLTRLQLENNLTELFKEYTKNPVVNVRFMNYTFSVLGEVNRSGKYNMVTERTTILDAISMAGDLTDLGRRDNITVIREENGERKVAKLSLLSKDIFNSPYFYLKTNDVVYVEPVKTKFIARSGVPQYLTFVGTALTAILTIVIIIQQN